MRLRHSNIFRQGGYTFIELALITSLVGILSTTALPRFIDISSRSQEITEDDTVAKVQSGIHLYYMQSLVDGRQPLYPSTLDVATSGEATVQNPIFSEILSHPVMRDWAKESSNRYRGPTGQIFVYDPSLGSIVSEGDAAVDSRARYGNLIGDTGYLSIYDSGATLLKDTPLSYIPNLDDGTVQLTLYNGIKVETSDDNTAVLTFPDETQIEIPDVTHGYTPLKSDYSVSEDGLLYSGEYVGVYQGHVYQSDHSIEYQTKEYEANPETGSYNYDYSYTMNSNYSGGSLDADNGYVYSANYQQDKPSQSRGMLTRFKDGSYAGVYHDEQSYNMEYHYGSTEQDSENPIGFSRFNKYGSWYDTTSSFNGASKILETESRGRYEFSYEEYDLQAKQSKGEIKYNYESKHKYNQKTGSYSGNYRYVYDNGSDYSYRYSYDSRTRVYKYYYTDNKTGTSREYTYQY